MKIYKVYQYNILYARGFCNPIYYLRFTFIFVFYILCYNNSIYILGNITGNSNITGNGNITSNGNITGNSNITGNGNITGK